MCNLIYSQKKTNENYSEVAFFTPPSGKDEKGYQRLLEKEAGRPRPPAGGRLGTNRNINSAQTLSDFPCRNVSSRSTAQKHECKGIYCPLHTLARLCSYVRTTNSGTRMLHRVPTGIPTPATVLSPRNRRWQHRTFTACMHVSSEFRTMYIY